MLLCVVLLLLCCQASNSAADGNAIQVSGTMSFGVWLKNGRKINENSLVPQTQELKANPEQEYALHIQQNIEGQTPSSVEDQFGAPPNQPNTQSEDSSSSEDQTGTEPPRTVQTTTEPPPQECAGFTPIVVSNFSPPASDVINETTSTFGECCSQVTSDVGSFSYTDGTCSYYYYWVDVATDDSVTISDDANIFVRKNPPGWCSLGKHTAEKQPHGTWFQENTILNGKSYTWNFNCDNGTLYYEKDNVRYPGQFLSTGFIFVSPPQKDMQSATNYCEQHAYRLFFRQDIEFTSSFTELFNWIDFLPPRVWVYIHSSADEYPFDYYWYPLPTLNILQESGTENGWVEDTPRVHDTVVFESNGDKSGLRDIEFNERGVPGLCYLPHQI